jgi:hypothetical protein
MAGSCNYLGWKSVLPITIIMLLSTSFTYTVVAISPSFSYQEVKDGDNDSLPYNETNLAKSNEVISDEKIRKLTGSSIGNIHSVSYVSDGKTLGVTYWLTAPFKNEIPAGHFPSYFAYIDADSNNQTGWNGIDYISEIAFDNNTRNWKNTLGAVSDVGYRLLETKNFTGFDKSGGGTYLFLSLNLSAMNFPEQYRIIFLEKDPIINKYTHTRFPVVDYVNAVHIPSPKFIMSSSSNSVELIPGDKKIIEIRLKSINPSTIANVQPQINFYPKNEPQGIRLSFQPNKTYLFPEGSSSELTIDPLQTLIPRTYTIPVFAKVTLPSEFFGNPTASMIVNSNLTATAIDWSQRIQQLASSWNPVISFIAAIVALITGAVGFIIGKKT